MRLPKWFRKANERRHVLVDRELDGTITPEEAKELQSIEEKMDWELDGIAPLPPVPDLRPAKGGE